MVVRAATAVRVAVTAIIPNAAIARGRRRVIDPHTTRWQGTRTKRRGKRRHGRVGARRSHPMLSRSRSRDDGQSRGRRRRVMRRQRRRDRGEPAQTWRCGRRFRVTAATSLIARRGPGRIVIGIRHDVHPPGNVPTVTPRWAAGECTGSPWQMTMAAARLAVRVRLARAAERPGEAFVGVREGFEGRPQPGLRTKRVRERFAGPTGASALGRLRGDGICVERVFRSRPPRHRGPHQVPGGRAEHGGDNEGDCAFLRSADRGDHRAGEAQGGCEGAGGECKAGCTSSEVGDHLW